MISWQFDWSQTCKYLQFYIAFNFLDCFLSKGVGSSKKFTGVLLCAWVQLICKRRAPLHIYPEITHVLKLKNITSDLIHICKPVFHHPSTFLNIFFLTFLSSPTGCKFLIKQIQNVYYAEYLRFYPQFMQIKMRICTYFSLSQQVSVTATADLLTLIFEVKVQCRSKIA